MPNKKTVAKKVTTKKPAPKKQAKLGKEFTVTTDNKGNIINIKTNIKKTNQYVLVSWFRN